MSTDSDRIEQHEQRLAEAMAWRVRLTEDPSQADDLEAWLMRDSAHVAAWHEVQDLWNFVGEHAAAPEAIAARRAALDRAHRHNRRRWRDRMPGRAIAASVALIALATLAGGVFWQLARPDVYRTALGERYTVTLSDGSAVSLDAASEVRVEYSERARELVLVKGQARFDVARDPLRPFAVQAGDQRVIATGTAFNIDLFGSQTSITLIEGRVLVLDVPESKAMEVRQGQRLVAAAQGPMQIQRVDIDQAIAWQQGQLIFDDEPLDAVVARVSRYTREQVAITDDSAAKLRLSGVINAGDLSSFVTTVTTYLPVQATRTPDGSVELRERPIAAR
ncbi:FecR family protein [Luteimonas sp. R10]|uniref:FecR family protein n=1 Tax=Luteimonas sp. R10 TaxID=3108176 RepID=UPI0030881BC9|nr:FecR domain-containing protein [Luteimonas sp. R10]